MEFQDTATDFDFRTRNDKLIPIMIKRLKACQIEAKEQRANQSQAFKRPFSMFSKNMSPSKSPSRRLSIENDENLVKSAQAINPPFFPASPNYPNLSNGDLSNRYDFIMLYQILIIQYRVKLVKTHQNSSKLVITCQNLSKSVKTRQRTASQSKSGFQTAFFNV